MKKKTATEVSIESSNNLNVIKAKFLYELFGSECVKITPQGLKPNVKLILERLSEIIY